MAKQNATVKQGSSPFMPPVFVQQPATLLGGAGAASPYTGPREDGPGAFVNYDGVTAVVYNGQTQTAAIANANPKPPRHFSPGAAPPSYSKIP